MDRDHITLAAPVGGDKNSWDVIRGIQIMAQEMTGLQLKYVAGHQDQTTAYRKLTFLAKLNVEADALATRYQREYGDHRPDVPFADWAGVHLRFLDGTITSHYETALRFQATAPPLQEYMQKKYSWSTTTWNCINWKAHGASLKKDIQKRTHLIKYVHGILPTNAQLHCRDKVRQRCPACGQGPETWLHIIRCHHSERQTWRAELLESITKTCTEKHTDP